ncbi:MAG: hypothetical protein ACRYF0_02765 [Janthinobacterium lividum]
MNLTSKDVFRLFTSSFVTWFGLIFFAVGFYALTVSDWLGVYFYVTPLASVPGRIVGSQETIFAVDEARVYETFYHYQAQGHKLVGSSFVTTTPMRPDTVAEVEYCLNRPTYSRLKDASTSPFGFTGLLTSLIFICVGFSTALKAILPNWRLLVLLKDIASTEATCQMLNKKPHSEDDNATFVAHYVYRVGGQQHMHLFETSETSKFGIKEPIVYQQANPNNAVLIARLPKFLQAKLPANYTR